MRRLTVIVLLTAFVGILNQGIAAAGALTSAPAVKATSWDPNDPGTEGINAGPADLVPERAFFAWRLDQKGQSTRRRPLPLCGSEGHGYRPTPNPSGATSAALQGVSCVGIGFCMAVGDAEIWGTQINTDRAVERF